MEQKQLYDEAVAPKSQRKANDVSVEAEKIRRMNAHEQVCFVGVWRREGAEGRGIGRESTGARQVRSKREHACECEVDARGMDALSGCPDCLRLRL